MPQVSRCFLKCSLGSPIQKPPTLLSRQTYHKSCFISLALYSGKNKRKTTHNETNKHKPNSHNYQKRKKKPASPKDPPQHWYSLHLPCFLSKLQKTLLSGFSFRAVALYATPEKYRYKYIRVWRWAPECLSHSLQMLISCFFQKGAVYLDLTHTPFFMM